MSVILILSGSSAWSKGRLGKGLFIDNSKTRLVEETSAVCLNRRLLPQEIANVTLHSHESASVLEVSKVLKNARFDTTGSSRDQLPADEDGDPVVH